jgi:hypothetical protein
VVAYVLLAALTSAFTDIGDWSLLGFVTKLSAWFEKNIAPSASSPSIKIISYNYFLFAVSPQGFWYYLENLNPRTQ